MLGVLVNPALVAACVSVKVKLNESTAIAAIEVLRVRIKFLPMSKPSNRSINAERQSQFLCCPLRAKSGHGDNLIGYLAFSMLWRDISNRGRAYSTARADKDRTAHARFAPRPGMRRIADVF